MSGYQSALSGMQAQQQQVMSGYNQLQANVLNSISGTSASQSQAVADYYTGVSGKATQDLTTRGLGNTTIVPNVQRGIGLDEQKAQTDVQNKFAQLGAQYQSQLGLAGLAYQGTALDQQRQLEQAQLGMMGSYASQQSQNALGYAGLNNAYNIALLGNRGGGSGGASGGNPFALRGTGSGGGTGGGYYGSGGTEPAGLQFNPVGLAQYGQGIVNQDSYDQYYGTGAYAPASDYGGGAGGGWEDSGA